MNQEKMVTPVEELSMEQLRREHAELADEVIQMDAELADQRNKFMRRQLTPELYFPWRADTVKVKAWHTRRMTLIKTEITTRTQAELADNRKESSSYHRRKAHALRMGLEQAQQELAEGKDETALQTMASTLLADRQS